MTPELSPRFSHPKLEEVIVALVAEPRVVMRIAFGAAADRETSARAAWDRETALDEPAVRFCNILLMMAKDAGATHLRVANGTIAYRVGAAWSAGPQLPREIRAHVLECVVWRLKQMSNIAPGPPEGTAAHSTLTLIFEPPIEGARPQQPAITFYTSFVRTMGECVLLLGVSEPRGRSDPRQSQLDELVAAGTTHNGSGRERDGQRVFERALALYETEPSCFPGGLVDVLNGLGLAFEGQWQHAKAEDFFRREVKAAAAAYGEESVVHAFSRTNLARFLIDRGELEEAGEHLARAESYFLSLVGADSAYLEARRQLGRLHRARGHVDEARDEALYVLARAEHFGSDALVVESSFDLGIIEHTRGELDSAAAHLRRALALMGEFAAWHPFAAEVGVALARVLMAQGKTPEAFRLFESARHILEKVRAREHPERVELAVEMARHQEQFAPYR